ncbi:MAG: (2Fe-2S) ferredoxin domain-containing protein [Cyanobacteria bacterium J06623_7]
MVAIQPLVSEFNLVGKLEDVVSDSKGRVKYLSLSTPEEDYAIAVAKAQTKTIGHNLQPGCQIRVAGMRKYKLHQGEVEYKAYYLEVLAAPAFVSTAVKRSHKTKKILVCQGSSCYKKGSKAISKQLCNVIAARGMGGEVEIKMTGCMKQCKQAPCIVMPGKQSYRRVQPQQISALVGTNMAFLQASKNNS